MASNQYAKYGGLGGGGGGSGTVTSVALALPGSLFSISGSPVTTTGTLTGSFIVQSANTVFAGPSSGAAAVPTFRALVAADLPVGNFTDTGTDGIVVTGGTGAVIGSGTSIAQHVADATHNGYLSSTDWSTFNGKQSALTLGNLTDVGTDGIVVTGGTGAVVGSGTSIAQHVADSTHNGYLSSTDWSTFNGKQAAGNYLTALTGDGTASGPGSAALTLATVNSNVGSFGSATQTGTFTVNAKGLVTAASSTTIAIPFSQVSGTVPLNQGGTGQTVKAAAFDALQPMTTGGDLICGGASGTGTRLANGSSGQYLKSAGGTSAPAWTSFVAPTIQKFTSGTGTYTTPVGVLYIRVRMVGAGGGGAGSSTASAANGGSGSTGGNSTFGTTLLVANGGAPGLGAGSNNGGAGGTASLGTGPIGSVFTGGRGGPSSQSSTSDTYMRGGDGASTPFGGSGGGGTANTAGNAGSTNTGAGGGGGGSPSNGIAGAGGGAGGFVDALIPSPSATYAFAIGAGGGAGSAGTGGFSGAAGAAGYIEVTEYYT